MPDLYLVTNGPMATTGPQAKVTTGTATKTLLQVQTSATRPLTIVEWGVSFDGSAAATPIQCELIDTYAVAATVTAHVAAGVQPFDGVSDSPVSTVTLGTSATGYTASAEGTVTQSRTLDLQLVAPSNQYIKQFPLGMSPFVPVSHNLRVRVTAAAAVNAYAYVLYAE
jgi:hypothetical protein